MVVKQDGKEVFRKKGGAVHVPEDKAYYYMYSCTKPITVAALMKLYEEGKLSLGTPVSEYIPAFANLTVKEKDGTLRPAKSVPTIKNLLQMTSGFTYVFPAEVIGSIDRKTQGHFSTVAAVEEFANIPLRSDPGEMFRYGISHDILAAVAEIITGEKFSDYVTRTILKPLGMNDTYWHVTDEIDARMEPQFNYKSETKEYIQRTKRNGFILGPDYDSGGAGLVSTVDDIETFCETLCNFGLGPNGVRILKPETVELMRTEKLPHEIVNELVPDAYGDGYTYGLGVRVCDRFPNETGSPIGEFSWAGAAGSFQIVSPEKHLSAFLAMHVLSGPAFTIRRNILKNLFEE